MDLARHDLLLVDNLIVGHGRMRWQEGYPREIWSPEGAETAAEGTACLLYKASMFQQGCLMKATFFCRFPSFHNREGLPTAPSSLFSYAEGQLGLRKVPRCTKSKFVHACQADAFRLHLRVRRRARGTEYNLN